MQIQKMRITVLGCGTSTGVPYIHCSCKVCKSRNPKNKRLRSSVWLQIWTDHDQSHGGAKNPVSILIDVSPDFRQQALTQKIPYLNAILFTHPHADHIGGLDEIRSYNYIQKETIPAYGHDWTIQALPDRYPYIFNGKVPEGGGVAQIDLREFRFDSKDGGKFQAAGIDVLPIELHHGSKKVAGFRIGNFAYLTDCHDIPEKSFEKLNGLDLLILDCLRFAKHHTHLSFEESQAYAERIEAKNTVFTHMSHDFDYVSFSKTLPKSQALAYDGLTISLK